METLPLIRIQVLGRASVMLSSMMGMQGRRLTVLRVMLIELTVMETRMMTVLSV